MSGFVAGTRFPEYMQALVAKEHIQQFLPVWIKRREDRPAGALQRMERWAKEQGVEHLL